METQEHDQIVTQRVLALSQLLVTALPPEEWAALAAATFEDNPANSKGNSTDAGEVRQ